VQREEDQEIHLNKTEARAASTPHVTRYVLAISGALIIILFIALVLFWR
jgi:hypothetical protein